LRSAEFGFFGVVVYTRVHTPRFCGLRFSAGRCNVTLREVGDYVRIAAQNCLEQCGSQAYLEPLLIDRRGNCRLLRGESR